MVKAVVPKREEELLPSSIFDSPKGENLKSQGQMLERKIDTLESSADTVDAGTMRPRRWRLPADATHNWRGGCRPVSMLDVGRACIKEIMAESKYLMNLRGYWLE